MNETLNQLNQQLSEYEEKLKHAYVNYAKILDNVNSTEMSKINEMVDEIINIKKQIIEEEGKLEND